MNKKVTEDPQARESLASLRAEWDRELAVLQRPDAAEKLRKAFDASPAEIAEAANAALRRMP